MKKIGMIGKKFGMLTVLNEVEYKKGGHIKYLCKCDCGNTCEVFGTHLRQGNTVSCKCKNKVNGVSSDMWYKIIKGSLKNRTKRNDLEINITKEYVNELFNAQNGKCKLSGVDLTLPKGWKDRSYTASLDRINSNLGYVEGNVQWVHKHINIMKNTFPQEMFIYLCHQVAKKNEIKEYSIEKVDNFKWGLNTKYE